MKQQLINYIKAGYGALGMTTAEYFRCINDITNATQALAGDIGSWDARGEVTNLLTGAVLADSLYEPGEMFEWVRNEIKNTEDENKFKFPNIWVINDFHLFMENPDPATLASFRDAIREGAQTNHHFILVGAQSKLCPEIEKMVTPIEFHLPGRDEILDYINGIYNNIVDQEGKKLKEVSDEEMERAINAASGMTSTEIEDAVSLSIISEGKLCWKLIMREKAKAVEKSGCLKYHNLNLSREDVGGNEVLMDYISLRKRSFSADAREFGCPAPKGIVAVGPAGTGKSLTAKVTASILDRPLISLDVGAVFGSLVGQSESQMRQAIKTIEACAPCVLMIDEIEKGLAGSKSSGQTDGGTGSRVIGTLLTWMNDKDSEVYIVATSNDVTALPPELLRKGRFDEIFFVDLPNNAEREVIFGIHLRKRGRDVKNFDMKKLVAETEGYTGAEIEQVVVDGLYIAFGTEKELTTEIILSVIKETSPLSILNGNQIKSLREWAKDRCRNASASKTKATKPAGNNRGRRITAAKGAGNE